MPLDALLLLLAGATAGAIGVALLLRYRPASDGRAAAQRPRSRASAEATIDQPPAELDRLGEVLNAGLLRIDQSGRIGWANQSAHRHLGRQPDTLIGLSPIAAFVDHRVEELLANAARRGTAEMDLAIGGEPQRTLLLTAVKATGGGAWLVVRDVSELRRLQRIRTEFIDNLSHELRTPLTTVRVLSEILSAEAERTQLPAPMREAIGSIDVETGHLAQMVSELLDLARIEQADTPLRRDSLDLGRVVEAVADRLRAYAQRQDVVLRTEVPSDEAERTVTGDEDRLEQMLINVVQNAVKFSRDGGEVTIRLRGQPDAVQIEVQDAGIGIPRADLDRIFERFYKVDRARVRHTGGTGLGLSIARHIVTGHGGRIWAESEEGVGSRFFIRLPRRAD